MLATLLLLLAGGCGENMVQQPRDDPYEATPLFADGKVLQAPPAGTIDRDAPVRAAGARRPPITSELLLRGRERYRIYCAMCHGLDGRGNGPVVARGFPAPPSYLEERLRTAPDAHFYDVMTDGYNIMYSYADRVAPADRWAIAAHIRALQASQPAMEAQRAR